MPTGVPSSERFSFCLGTVLSDVAARRPDKREAILSAQVRVFADLVAAVRAHRETADPSNMAARGTCVIPTAVWLPFPLMSSGLLRGEGGFSVARKSDWTKFVMRQMASSPRNITYNVYAL